MALTKQLQLLRPSPPHLLSLIVRRFSIRRPISPFPAKGYKWAKGKGYKQNPLPPELSKNVVTLTCDSTAKGGVCHVYVVGTRHRSKESCQEVEGVIDFVKPQALFLELCHSRASVVMQQSLELPTVAQMEGVLRAQMEQGIKGYVNLSRIISESILDMVAQSNGVPPGGEFGIAYKAAAKYGKEVNLGDRPIDITLKRAWAKMSLWEKLKRVFLLLQHGRSAYSSIPFKYIFKVTKAIGDCDGASLTLIIREISKNMKMKEDIIRDSMDQMMEVMSNACPTLMETILCERDLYMSASLLAMARKHNVVVAVVGRAHLPGIQKNWGRHVPREALEELLTIPSRDKTFSVGKILSAIGVTAASIAIASYLFPSSRK